MDKNKLSENARDLVRAWTAVTTDEDRALARALEHTGLRRRGSWSSEWSIPDPVFSAMPKKEQSDEAIVPQQIVSRDLTEEQQQAFDRIVKWDRDGRTSEDILRIGGYGGTGKSTLLSLFAKQSSRTAFCCFTAKATDVLRKNMRRLGMPPSFLENNVRTIHGLIYRPIEDGKGGISGWMRRTDEQVRQSFDRIVIDEASMVNVKMLEDIKAFDLPILAVGDHGQLPPVEGQGSLMVDPDVKLETIHRQALGNPIIALAQEIRQTGHLPRHDTLPKDGPIQFASISSLPDLLKRLYGRYQPRDVALLTYMNSTRQKFNRLGRKAWLGDKFEQDAIVPTEQVICLKNHGKEVFNGMRGTVVGDPNALYAYWWELEVDFEDHDLHMKAAVLKGQFGHPSTFSNLVEVQQQLRLGVAHWQEAGLLFDFGYALTVHKSQGSGFGAVVLKWERPGPVSAADFKRWGYTACSRAINELYVVV